MRTRHSPNILRAIIAPYPPQSGLQLTSRLEEMRLLESRKSSRLSGQANTDFSKLADFNIVHERKRLNSEKSSDGSEFCGSVIPHCSSYLKTVPAKRCWQPVHAAWLQP